MSGGGVAPVSAPAPVHPVDQTAPTQDLLPSHLGDVGFDDEYDADYSLEEIDASGHQDPYSDFGRLSTEIWRAVRLVVDTGIHAKGWPEEGAVAYFKENSAIADGAIRAEVRRYFSMPAQATAYKIGMIKILELRTYASEALGEHFDIRDFHDTVLGGGALPLTLLERRVQQWVAAQLEKAAADTDSGGDR